MSTRGHIGFEDEVGDLFAVYNHHDSYPEGLLEDAKNFITDEGPEEFMAWVKRGAEFGGFRSFPEHYDEPGNYVGETSPEALDNDYAYIFNFRGKLSKVYKWGDPQPLEDYQ